MLTAHHNLVKHGTLPESRRQALVNKPFAVRDRALGAKVEAVAFGYKELTPIIEIDGRKYRGMTWIEVSAAVERGAVPELARLERVRC